MKLQGMRIASPPMFSATWVSSGPAESEAPPETHSGRTSRESYDNMSLTRSPTGNLLLHNTQGLSPGRNTRCLEAAEQSPSFLRQLSTIPPGMNSFSPFDQQLAFNTSVTFSYYPFLKVQELTRLDEGDVRYLESKGCLHIPSRSHLDQFIRHYFMYVHPCTPILDEERFWDMYLNTSRNNDKTETISLLLFQAMLFAATSVSFIP